MSVYDERTFRTNFVKGVHVVVAYDRIVSKHKTLKEANEAAERYERNQQTETQRMPSWLRDFIEG